MDSAKGKAISSSASAFETLKPGQDDPLNHYGVFEEKRQLTLTGQDYPHITSYTDHYPPKSVPIEYPPAGDPGQPLPFNGKSTFQADYPGWDPKAGSPLKGAPVKVGAPYVMVRPLTVPWLRGQRFILLFFQPFRAPQLSRFWSRHACANLPFKCN